MNRMDTSIGCYPTKPLDSIVGKSNAFFLIIRCYCPKQSFNDTGRAFFTTHWTVKLAFGSFHWLPLEPRTPAGRDTRRDVSRLYIKLTSPRLPVWCGHGE